MKTQSVSERFVAENISEVIWLRLRRLSSSRLCRQIITGRSPHLSADIVERKAKGMSWAVRNALGYWDTKSGGLNAQILSRYYALLQISIAEQIATSDPQDNLQSIQRHTEYGHGLFTILSGPEFPEHYLLGCLKSGHFSAYCKNLSVDLGPFVFEKRPRNKEATSNPNVISLRDLFRRVPELQTSIPEYLGVTPLSFHIGHASRNFQLRAERMQAHAMKTGKVLFDPPQGGQDVTTWVAIWTQGYEISIEDLSSTRIPINNIVEEQDSLSNSKYYVGEITHPRSDFWWQHITTYKSGYPVVITTNLTFGEWPQVFADAK